ncbi:MAG TPA: hypothetical protein VMS93_05010 [Candidatus Saccharimonadales bacterium]|nr:hypothetical protein [Candidatus Saccharimonadales bacterium]
MNRKLLLILVLAAAAGAACAAAAPAFAAGTALADPGRSPNDPAASASAWRDLQAGANRADAATLLRAQGAFEALAEADPSSAALRCGVALADWRVVPLLLRQESTRAQAQAAVESGLAQCEAVLQKQPGHPLALALKGSLQAFLVGLQPEQAMTMGMESGANLKRASELAPANPRVQLLEAIYTLHKPGFVGGGADKALPEFLRAVELFRDDAPGDSTAPAWGRDDALLWAGRAAAQLGRAQEAHDFYRRAVEANPANGWARQLLQADSTGGSQGRP